MIKFGKIIILIIVILGIILVVWGVLFLSTRTQTETKEGEISQKLVPGDSGFEQEVYQDFQQVTGIPFPDFYNSLTTEEKECIDSVLGEGKLDRMLRGDFPSASNYPTGEEIAGISNCAPYKP